MTTLRTHWPSLLVLVLLLLNGHLHAQYGTLPSSRPEASTGALFPVREALVTIPTEASFRLPKGTHLPARVDLSAHFPPAGLQGRRNSCTGWAVGYGLKTVQENLRQQRTVVQGEGTFDPDHTFSPAFVYNYSMQQLTPGDCDQGSFISSAITVAVTNGVCTWAALPYDSAYTGCKDSLTDGMLREALPHRMAFPVRLDSGNFDQWKYHLMMRTPIVIGLGIDTSFHRAGRRAAKAGQEFIWQMPAPNSAINGHALVVGGYDDADSTFLVFNSWGQQWGRLGWAKIPYRVMAEMSYEAYVLQPGIEAGPLLAIERPADRRTDVGDELEESFKPGEFQDFEGLRMRLMRVSKERNKVQVQFTSIGNETLTRTIEFCKKQPVSFHIGGSCWTFTYRSWNPFSLGVGPRIYFRIGKILTAQDPDIDEALRQVERLRERGAP